MSVQVLCVGGGTGCTLAHHTAWQAFIANLHATPINCQLCILKSLPPLHKQLEFWGLAFLANLHCSVGVVCVLAYLSTLMPDLHHAATLLLVSHINLHASFLATFADEAT